MTRRLLAGLVVILALLPGCLRKRASATFVSTGIASRTAGPAPSGTPASTKGKMVLNVEGTNLDFPLEALIVRGNSFELTGQGVKLTGTLSPGWDGNWDKLAGQTLTIVPRDAVFGNSELDLPGTGSAPVTGGRILVENVSAGQRLRGRISFSVQGPFGVRPFAGTCEVGVVRN